MPELCSASGGRPKTVRFSDQERGASLDMVATAPNSELTTARRYGFTKVIPALMEIQQHEDKFNPIKSLLFDEAKQDKFYGKELGTIYETKT